jgi:glyoxylase-like metal-dependent hydrolase (beta-lactamase superfamily II)
MNEVKIRELQAGIFLMHLPLPMRPTIVNVYLIRGADEWALVDTGVNSRDSIAAFEAGLKEAGCRPERIRKILCTHHHPDHYGTSQTYKELTGADVYLHDLEYQRSLAYAPGKIPEQGVRFFVANGIPVHRFARIPSQGDFWAQLYKPARPDRKFEDGDVVMVGERRIEMVWTPGHAPGHCVLYLPLEKVLIVGDHLLPKITPHVGWAPGGAENPLGDFLDSQRKVQQLDVDSVLPAHGAVYADHRRRANQIIQHHDYRMREIYDVIRNRPRTAYDIAAKVFGFDADSPLQVQFPATFETLAHLRHMMTLGRVVHEEHDEQELYAGR